MKFKEIVDRKVTSVPNPGYYPTTTPVGEVGVVLCSGVDLDTTLYPEFFVFVHFPGYGNYVRKWKDLVLVNDRETKIEEHYEI